MHVLSKSSLPQSPLWTLCDSSDTVGPVMDVCIGHKRSSIDCHKWNGMRASSNKPLRITAWPSERHVSSQRCIQWRTLHCWNKRIWSDQLNSLSHLQFGSLDAQRREKKWSFVVFAHFCVPASWNHLSWKTLARSNPTEWGWEAMV